MYVYYIPDTLSLGEMRSGTRRTGSLREGVCQVPTHFLRSGAATNIHPKSYAVTSPVRLGEGGCAGAKVRFLQMMMVRCRRRGCRECLFLAESDGSIGTKRFLAGRWSEYMGICCFQTVGSASALSERTSRSEAENLVSATHFHERERVWK